MTMPDDVSVVSSKETILAKVPCVLKYTDRNSPILSFQFDGKHREYSGGHDLPNFADVHFNAMDNKNRGGYNEDKDRRKPCCSIHTRVRDCSGSSSKMAPMAKRDLYAPHDRFEEPRMVTSLPNSRTRQDQRNGPCPHLAFFKGAVTVPELNLKVDDILVKYHQNHDMIKKDLPVLMSYLFPIAQPDGITMPITDQEVMLMNADQATMKRYIRGYEMILDFYGMRLLSKSIGMVDRAPHWERRYKKLRASEFCHQVKRILTSLGDVGLETYKKLWLTFLITDIVVEKDLLFYDWKQAIKSIRQYWIPTLKDEAEQQDFFHFLWECELDNSIVGRPLNEKYQNQSKSFAQCEGDKENLSNTLEDIRTKANYKKRGHKSSICPLYKIKPRENCHLTGVDPNLEKELMSMWVPALNLTVLDHKVLLSKGRAAWLSDKHINAAQALLKINYPFIGGLRDPIVVVHSKGCLKADDPYVQILNMDGVHWVCISNVNSTPGVVVLYNTMDTNDRLSDQFLNDIAKIEGNHNYMLAVADCQKQPNSYDCGLFAIAMACDLCRKLDPTQMYYSPTQLRPHLEKCFLKQSIEPFPAKPRAITQPIVKFLPGPDLTFRTT